jgi:hypothetical protein
MAGILIEAARFGNPWIMHPAVRSGGRAGLPPSRLILRFANIARESKQ